jgi:ketosteroid isomerase-like protein
MASANLDLVRSIYADWERGDFGSVDWAHPEIEYVHVDGPAPGSWRGFAEVAEAWRGFLSAWEELSVAAEEYLELDDERVLVLSHFSARGKTSGLEARDLGTREANLFQLRDGKVTRLVLYWDRERAFADLGLVPKTESSPS